MYLVSVDCGLSIYLHDGLSGVVVGAFACVYLSRHLAATFPGRSQIGSAIRRGELECLSRGRRGIGRDSFLLSGITARSARSETDRGLE